MDVAKVEVCANDVCSSSGWRVVRLPLKGDSVVRTASARFLADDGREILAATFKGVARTTKLQPNGPDCAPTCFVVQLRLTDTGELEPAKVPS